MMSTKNNNEKKTSYPTDSFPTSPYPTETQTTINQPTPANNLQERVVIIQQQALPVYTVFHKYPQPIVW